MSFEFGFGYSRNRTVSEEVEKVKEPCWVYYATENEFKYDLFGTRGLDPKIWIRIDKSHPGQNPNQNKLTSPLPVPQSMRFDELRSIFWRTKFYGKLVKKLLFLGVSIKPLNNNVLDLRETIAKKIQEEAKKVWPEIEVVFQATNFIPNDRKKDGKKSLRTSEDSVTVVRDPYGIESIDKTTLVVILSRDNPWRELLGQKLCRGRRPDWIKPAAIMCTPFISEYPITITKYTSTPDESPGELIDLVNYKSNYTCMPWTQGNLFVGDGLTPESLVISGLFVYFKE